MNNKPKNISDALSVIESLMVKIKNEQKVKYFRQKLENVNKDYESLLKIICKLYRVVHDCTKVNKFLKRIAHPFIRANLKKILIYNPQILEIMTKLNKSEVLSLDGRYFLIYGKCQSGKTRFMQDIIFSHILINKCAAIIILRNSVGDSKQLQKRCDEYKLNCQRWMKINHRNLKGNNLNFVYANNDSKLGKMQMALSGKKPSLIIVISNTSQMKRLGDAIHGVSKPRYVVAIDEADQVAYGNKRSSFRTILSKKVLHKAGRVYGVTATSFDMIFSEENIKTASIIILGQRSNYHGLKKIQLRALDTKANPGNKRNDWFDNDKNIIPVLIYLGERDCYKDKISDPCLNIPKHPTITIIKNTYLKYSQDKLLRNIVKHPNLKMWSIIIYNGTGITVYHPKSALLKKMNGVTSSKRKFAGGDNIQHSLFFKGVCIGDGLEYLRQLDTILKDKGMARVTHIGVISGGLANRGISFVSSEYHWHPTSMYYVPSKSATVSQVIQSAGRLCGNFDDNIPLQLFAPKETLEDLRKGIHLQEDLLTQVKNSGKKKTIIKVLLKTLPVSKAKIPTRELGHQPKKLGKEIEGQDQGASIKIYNKNPIIKMLDTKKKEIKSMIGNKNKLLSEKEFNKLTNVMFPKWARENTNIAKLMKGLSPTKIYTKEEMNKYCKLYNKRIITLMKRDNNKDYGFILLLTEQGYKLYPCLINKFKEHFHIK